MNPIQQAEQSLETAVALLHGHGKTVDPSIEAAHGIGSNTKEHPNE